MENKQSSCDESKCYASTTTSQTTVKPWSNALTPSLSIQSPLLLANQQLIIMSDSMLAKCLTANRLEGCDFSSSVSLLSRPPEITLLSEESTCGHQLCLPAPSTGRCSSTSNSLSTEIQAPIDDKPVQDLEEDSSKVCVIPDLPQCADHLDINTVEPAGELPKEGKCYGEDIINALATSIYSISKHQNSNKDYHFEESKPVEAVNQPLMIPQLTLPVVSQRTLHTPFLGFMAAEKEQLLEDSDNELEIPNQDSEDSAQNNSNSASIQCEQWPASPPPVITQPTNSVLSSVKNMTNIQSTLAKTDGSRSKMNSKVQLFKQQEPGLEEEAEFSPCKRKRVTHEITPGITQLDYCEEPMMAKKQKLETDEITEYDQISPSVSRTYCDPNNSFADIEASFQQGKNLAHDVPIFSVTLDMTATASVCPHEPTTNTHDGQDTAKQALPMESAREHALIPNLPKCAQQAINSDSSESDDEDNGHQAALNLQSLSNQLSPKGNQHQTSITVSPECQVVPGELAPLETSFSSKSLYPDIRQDKSLPDVGKSKASMEGIDIENMDDTSVLEYTLDSMRNKTTQTMHPSQEANPSNDDLISPIPYKLRNCFTFRPNAGTVTELYPTTRLNLSKPRLRLGLSKRGKTKPHK